MTSLEKKLREIRSDIDRMIVGLYPHRDVSIPVPAQADPRKPDPVQAGESYFKSRFTSLYPGLSFHSFPDAVDVMSQEIKSLRSSRESYQQTISRVEARNAEQLKMLQHSEKVNYEQKDVIARIARDRDRLQEEIPRLQKNITRLINKNADLGRDFQSAQRNISALMKAAEERDDANRNLALDKNKLEFANDILSKQNRRLEDEIDCLKKDGRLKSHKFLDYRCREGGCQGLTFQSEKDELESRISELKRDNDRLAFRLECEQKEGKPYGGSD